MAQIDGASTDRPLLGILLMLGFCATIPLSDAIVKLLGETIPLLELLVVRFCAQALLLVPVLMHGSRAIAMPPRILKLTIARTLLHIIGIGAMFASLRFLPLADAVAIAFVMPFLLLLLGRWLLKEEVGPRRLSACAVGFLGTLLVIQPSLAEVGWPALLPLLVALSFAFYILVTRRIAQEADPIVLQGVSGLMGAVGLSVLLVLTLQSGIPGTGVVAPNAQEAVLMAMSGLLGAFAHLLMTWSLRFAPSATLAPMQYLEIPFATLIGWIVFRDLPDGLAAVGIAVTMAAGLYIVMRERKLAEPVPPES
ncbi:DMT family transporter [Chelativorans sp. AA-79]|uniref:DMT family transporter n=1 Tax=Chelativorans sp. AA-79 TaxID=3028735 RepID=UPI0023F9333A|nr:DMT family transporter [Chelativorans sp. AA-79]WEX08476.1 DMT family transporter [Chelativorans sp. AA-79]